MEDLKTKSGAKRLPVDTFVFSTSEVTEYLTKSILGIPDRSISCDYARWVGVSEKKSYIRMLVYLSPSVVMKKEEAKYYGEKILAQHSANTNIRKDLLDVLAPFTYPEINNNDIAALQELFTKGLSGSRLEEIRRFRKLTYIPQHDVFCIYLRPEKIIQDMLSDPDSDIPREINVAEVTGMTSESIAWKIEIDRGLKTIPVGGNLSSYFR